jgi:hypothetical protein
MFQFLLFMSAFLTAMLFFDYIKTRNMVRKSTIEKSLSDAQNEIAALKERIQHLEAIVTADSDDIWGERNNSTSQFDREPRNKA